MIDGSNIAYEGNKTKKEKAKLSNIMLVKKTFDSNGINNYKTICDHCLYFCIDNQEDYTHFVKNEEIIVTPSKTEADIFILQYARKNDAFIISNDRYKKYFELFGKEWIEERAISFRFIGNVIYFDKLIL